MPAEPRPLNEGVLLAERFEIETVLGRGGFGIVYRAKDLLRNDAVVVKELAPDGVLRNDQGILNLHEDTAHRLRQQFLDEAKTMARLHLRGILPVRLGFTENGTAYYATDYLPNAITLERTIQKEGPMDMAGALDIVYQLLETLEQVHKKGILHRDIKPSNILIGGDGEATLIDFGAAREWHADSTTHHTVLFTPGYAPLEQMAERARRGPATDLYALCATAYEMLSGRKPVSATDRATGVALTSLASLRPDVDNGVARAIEAGLELKYSDRPQTVEEFRELLNDPGELAAHNSLLEYDAKMVRLQRFGYERRQCPGCPNGLLEEPKPLRKGVCPVCREGTIKKREIHPGLCPVCRISPLKSYRNIDPMHTCPKCRVGWLTIRKKGLLSKEIVAECPACQATFAGTQSEAEGRSWSEWLIEAGRSETVFHCESCTAQFDEEADGRLLSVVAERPLKHTRLYPEEWDCVAAGLEPGAGNAECSACGADYYLQGENVTLIGSKDDPYGFAKSHLGRLLTLEDNRWMGVGKLSPHPGFVCHTCHTEFDRDGDYLRLVRTRNRILQKHLDEPIKLIDWHRLAESLPTVSEEAEFKEGLTGEIVVSYESGEIGFEEQNRTLWRGPAVRVDQDANGTLIVTREEVQFGGVFRKWRIPFDAILSASAEENTMWLRVSGEPEPIAFEIAPIEFTAHLESGRYVTQLGAPNLATRILAERSTR